MESTREMTFTVQEEPAWRRILEIRIAKELVARELDAILQESRKRLVLPGFRKGKVPADLARKHLGPELDHEVIRRIVPRAVGEAIEESGLRPLGDPGITDLHFHPGEECTFKAVVEIVPEVEIKEYEGLKLTQEPAEIQEEDLNQVLDHLREQAAELEEVDRPAQGGDIVTIRYRDVDATGEAAEAEPQETALELGSDRTPEAFNQELLGSVIGDMKKIALPYPEDYPEESLAGTTRNFHVTVGKIEEKIWPPLDDGFAAKVLGTEDAKAEDLKTRVRLNLEAEAAMKAKKALETKLLNRLLELNPFEVPRGVVESTLDRILEQGKKEGRTLPPDEEARIREQYRPSVEHSYKTDILVDAVGKQESITLTEEDLTQEIESFAEQEQQNPAQVRAKLKREGNLDRLRRDLFRRRVVDRLVEKADISSPAPAEGKEG